LSRRERLQYQHLALAGWFCPIEGIREIISPARADVKDLSVKLKELPAPLIVPSAFLLMTLGLNAKDLHGAPLIVYSFDVVNNALATKNHSNDSWELLSPELPYIGWLRDWDRCAKLKLAVHSWLVRYTGSIDLSLEDALREVNSSLSSESGMHQEHRDY
jgi:hypothetical protein